MTSLAALINEKEQGEESHSHHTMQIAILLSLASLVAGGYYKPAAPKTTKCYQCSYSPDRTRVSVVKVPRVAYSVARTPVVVKEQRTRVVVEQQPIQVTRIVKIFVDVSSVEYDVVKVPHQVSRQVRTPRVVEDVIKRPMVEKFPVTVTRMEEMFVTRTKKEKVPVYNEYGYGPRYEMKTVTFQDVEQRVVKDTVYETRMTFTTVVKTRMVFDTHTETSTAFTTQQVSRATFSKVPRTKMVSDQSVVSVSRIETDVMTRQDFVTHQQSHQVFETKQVQKKVSGGWDKCMGPFDNNQAEFYGVDVWKCHDNCYTRVEDNGNIFRGCYKGEYNVDPRMMGCNRQAGATYCFCEGDKCNNGGVEAAPAAAASGSASSSSDGYYVK